MSSFFDGDDNVDVDQKDISYNVIRYQDKYGMRPKVSENIQPRERERLQSKHGIETSCTKNEPTQESLIKKLNRLITMNQKPERFKDFPVYLVVDTNVLLSNVIPIQNLAILAKFYHFQIIVPREVIRELDSLKVSVKVDEQGKNIGLAARKAIKWIFNELSCNSDVIRGQKIDEVLNVNSSNDDSIYDCLMYFKSKLLKTGLPDIPLRGLVVLLSNDKNLCIRALNDSILTITFTATANSEFFAKSIYNEAYQREATISGKRISQNESTEGNDNTTEYIHYSDNFINDNFPDKIIENSLTRNGSKNPYLLDQTLGDGNPLFIQLFNHIGNLSKSMVGYYINNLSNNNLVELHHLNTLNEIFNSNNSLNRTLYLIIEAIKMNWDVLRLNDLLAQNNAMNSICSASLPYLSSYSNMKIVRNTKNDKIQISIIDEQGLITNIPRSQEKFLYEIPDTTFKLKKFQIFWSIMSCKITCVLISSSIDNNTTQDKAMNKLIQLWDEVIQYLVKKNIIPINEL